MMIIDPYDLTKMLDAENVYVQKIKDEGKRLGLGELPEQAERDLRMGFRIYELIQLEFKRARAAKEPEGRAICNVCRSEWVLGAVHPQIGYVIKQGAPCPSELCNGHIVEVRSVPTPEPCNIPPVGWSCSRAKGHGGPCAASPV